MKIIHQVLKTLNAYKRSVQTWYKCKRAGLKYDPTWRIMGKIIVCKPNLFHTPSKIIIGHHFQAQADPAWNTYGIIQPNILNVRSGGAEIILGDNVGISGSIISSAQSIQIGNNVLIGSGCVICDNDAHPIKSSDRDDQSKVQAKPIIIEDDVFIGARCLVLKGVKIGRGAMVGAGSVVTKNIPPCEIWAGNPAKYIKSIKK